MGIEEWEREILYIVGLLAGTLASIEGMGFFTILVSAMVALYIYNKEKK